MDNVEFPVVPAREGEAGVGVGEGAGEPVREGVVDPVVEPANWRYAADAAPEEGITSVKTTVYDE